MHEHKVELHALLSESNFVITALAGGYIPRMSYLCREEFIRSKQLLDDLADDPHPRIAQARVVFTFALCITFCLLSLWYTSQIHIYSTIISLNYADFVFILWELKNSVIFILIASFRFFRIIFCSTNIVPVVFRAHWILQLMLCSKHSRPSDGNA